VDKKHIIFGTGPLGLSVMRALVKRGKQVVLVNRSGKIKMASLEGLDIVAGDAFDRDFATRVTKGTEAIYQCAQPAYHEWVTKFPQLQKSILEAASDNSVKLIVGENLYMYGDTNGQPMFEDSPYLATTRKGKVRAEMSNELMALHRAGRVQVTIARGSDFYGPGVLSSALGERTILPLLKGKPAEVTGSLDQPHTYTYINDFGEALAILGEHEEAFGQVWHVPNPKTLTQRELINLFFKEAGLEPKFSVMGRMMLTLGGMFIPAARETIEMMYEFEKPFLVDSHKFISAYGNIATPHEIAVKETIDWYESNFQISH
jgi:nucleoside-diphosphate-sugar epimerase